MCFDFDSRPPDLPADLVGPPISGGAGAEVFQLRSADATEFSAAFAAGPEGSEPAVLILPDVRGLYSFYIELAERFAQAGHHAIAIDYYGRTAGLGPRGDDFDYGPHREQVKLDQASDDIRAALDALRERSGAASAVTVGFCFGGSLSFVSGANPDLDLTAVAGLYGVLDASRFDGNGPLSQARAPGSRSLACSAGPIRRSRRTTSSPSRGAGRPGVEHEIHVYPGAPHSFFDKKQHEFAEESENAWRRLLVFLAGVRKRAA